MPSQHDYEVMTPIKKNPSDPSEKTRWHNVGRAWKDEGGSGRIVIILDSIPFRSEYLHLFVVDDGPQRKG